MKHLLSVLSIAVVSATCAVADSASIQSLIDSAKPGDVVRIPAGIHEGAIQLRPGVFVVGEGAEATVIDGKGADVVVLGSKKAAIVGVTIRNGRTAFHNGGMFSAAFECRIEPQNSFGVRFEGGSGILANSHVAGSGGGIGVGSIGANPLIANNLIENNNVGLMVAYRYVPTVVDNVFLNNRTAIRVNDDCSIILERNIFDGNTENIVGANLGATDEVRASTEDERARPTDQELVAYRELMDRVFDEAASLQGRVIYDLTEETGRFHLGIMMPWATFNIGASAKDTVIETYDAYDRTTSGALNAGFAWLPDQRPSIDVSNPQITEKALDRFVLEKIFVHPASYQRREDGALVFDRETNLPRIEVRVPPTYHVVEANDGAEIDSDETGREIVRLKDMGMTRVRVVMKPLTQ